MSNTTLAPSALGVTSGTTEAGFGRILATLATVEGKRIDATLKAAVALVFALANGSITLPAEGRANDVLSERFPTLGSGRQIGNLRRTGEAVAALGLDDIDAARAIHSAVGYGVTSKALGEAVTTLREGDAAPSAIVAMMTTLAAEAKAAKADRAVKATADRAAAKAKADEAERSGEAVTVKADASRLARLEALAKAASVVKGAEMTDAEKMALSALAAHVTRLAFEAGSNVEDIAALAS